MILYIAQKEQKKIHFNVFKGDFFASLFNFFLCIVPNVQSEGGSGKGYCFIWLALTEHRVRADQLQLDHPKQKVQGVNRAIVYICWGHVVLRKKKVQLIVI